MATKKKEKKKYNYIFCDLDGTLLDDSGRHYKCYCDIVKKFGGKCIDKETYWEDKRNKVKRTVLLEKTRFKGTYEEYLETWNEWIETEKYLEYEQPRANMMEAIDCLNEFSDEVILITLRQKRKELEWQLKNYEIYDKFKEVLKGDPGGSKADIIKLRYDLSRRTKLPSEKFLVIGDTEADQELARAIGATFIAVTSGLRHGKYLSGADYMIEKLDELRGILLLD